MSHRKAKSLPEPPAAPLFLALETATPVCSLALMRGAEAEFSLSFRPQAGHSARLMPAVEAMLELTRTSRSDWAAVVVSRGPGSFTGLRIGLATGKALAMGLGIPLYGVSTLEALAMRVAGLAGGPVCALLDARKGQVFAAVYRPAAGGLHTVAAPAALHPDDLPRFAPPAALFTGDALDLYGDVLERAYGRRLRLAPAHLRLPAASTVGSLGLEKVASGAPGEIMSLVPEYVRASDAEINYGQGIAPADDAQD